MKLTSLKRFGRIGFVGLLLAVGATSVTNAQEGVDATVVQKQIMTLDWPDLIPENERGIRPQNNVPVNHEEDTPPQNTFVGFRDDLDGQQIRIPGFVIPLEGDSEVVTELLLVPYFGACIHVPPPPPNQIVYVKFEKGVPVQGLWDVVYIVGKLNVETVESGLGQAGYLINGVTVEDYEDTGA